MSNEVANKVKEVLGEFSAIAGESLNTLLEWHKGNGLRVDNFQGAKNLSSFENGQSIENFEKALKAHETAEQLQGLTACR